MKVLLIVEQCNPEWASAPLVGYRYYAALSRLVDVTLVTHERNRDALARAGVEGTVIIPESRAAHYYNRAAGRLSERRGSINWPMRHALTYPVYAEFNRRVFRQCGGTVARGIYDVVHAFTPILPRYPVKIIEACRNTPFVLGPVNGGLLYPAGFDHVARKEAGQFSFLRRFARLLPGYRQTYRRADKLLAGSTATLQMLRPYCSGRLDGSGGRIELLHENGVSAEFFAARIPPPRQDAIRLLFVGRLVPCKCADVVLEAVSLLDAELRRRTTLTIVGDGPERQALETQAARLGIAEQVQFTRWLPQERTLEFYRRSDIFCFPSVREFGGAVVLEAMAAGLPCIVADYGGIAEFVTASTGFRIALHTRDRLVHQMARHIEDLARNRELRDGMSAKAVERAREFTWERKARRTVSIYENLIERKRTQQRTNA